MDNPGQNGFLPCPFTFGVVPSNRIYRARLAILVIPVSFIAVGYLAMFLTDDIGTLWAALWLGLVVTIIFLLHMVIAMLDEVIETM